MVAVGLIGCGNWGRNLLRALSEQHGVNAISVADKSQAALDYVRTRYPHVDVKSEASELLEDSSIEAVCIATPASNHVRDVTAALDAGKHVFVEKPLAFSANDAEALLGRAQRSGLVLMVGHTMMYNDTVHYVKNVIDSGELGDIRYIYLQRLNLGIVRQDVNVLWNLAPHDMSILLYWIGSAPIDVQAHGMAFLRSDIEDVAFLYLRFPNGICAHVHLSWLDPHKTRTATVVGSRKMLVYDDTSVDRPVTIFDSGVDIDQRLSKGTDWETFGEFQTIHRRGEVRIPSFPRKEPLANEMEAFIHSVVTGEMPPSGGQHALEVVRALEAADIAMRASRA